MPKIIVSNEQNYPFPFKTDIEKIMELIKIKLNYEIEIEIELSLVDTNKIKNLNKLYRDQDNKTDIISVPAVEYKIAKQIKLWYLGDIFICYDEVLTQALKFNHSVKREFLYLFTHGVFHLFGFDHLNEKDKIIMDMHVSEIMSKISVERI